MRSVLRKNFLGIYIFFLTPKDITCRGGTLCAKVNLKPDGHLLRTTDTKEIEILTHTALQFSPEIAQLPVYSSC